MGYGEQVTDLHEIEDAASNLRSWINGEHETFPPYSLMAALAPRIQEVRDELVRMLSVTKHLTPARGDLYSRFRSLVSPYEIEEAMALKRGEGAYIRVGHPSSAQFGNREMDAPFQPDAGGDISVAVYIDSDDEETTRRITDAVDLLVDAMGYDGPLELEVERGSLFRRSRAKAKQVFASPELQARLVRIERALELAGLELNQAQVDQREADAVARLLAALESVPRGCIRAGSVLAAKCTTADGPVIWVRTLSQLEIQALEKYPEIQRNPETILEALVIAIESLSANVPGLSSGDDSA